MTNPRTRNRRRLPLTLAAAAAALVASLPALAAEPVPELYDGKSTTYEIIPGSILRRGEGFTSAIVTTMFKGGTVQGDGICSKVACPVIYNGEHVFARRTRLRLPSPAKAAGGNSSGIGSTASPGGSTSGGPAAGAGRFAVNRTLRRGDQGEDVLHLQEALNKTGATMVIDKNYGRGTREAVRKFQEAKGLKADGVAGPMTLRALGL